MTLPGALDYALTGMRMALMNAFMTVVAAEMLAAEVGLGFLTARFTSWMETDSIFVGMLTLGIARPDSRPASSSLVSRTLLRRFSFPSESI